MTSTRLTLAEAFTRSPDFYWVMLHIAWGAIYAALLVSVVAMLRIGQHYLTKYPKRVVLVLIAQSLWSLLSLTGVFCIPWVIGTFAPDVLMDERFTLIFIASWAVTFVCVWILAKEIFKEIWT